MAGDLPRPGQRLLRAAAARARARRRRWLRVDRDRRVPGLAAGVRHVAVGRLAGAALRRATRTDRGGHLPARPHRARLRPLLYRLGHDAAGRRAGRQLPRDGAQHPRHAWRLGALAPVRPALDRPDRPVRRGRDPGRAHRP